MAMDLSNLELDLEHIGVWSTSVKITVATLVFLLLLGVGYWFDIRNQLTRLDQEEQKRVTLEKQIISEQKKVWPVKVLEEQIKSIKAYLKETLAQLPTSDEIPKVIEDISAEGIKAGLEFKSIRPLSEVTHSFYAETPISISVVGNYHQLGHFLSNLSALPRYVTITDFSIQPFLEKGKKQSQDQEESRLMMSLQANIYRHISSEKEEI